MKTLVLFLLILFCTMEVNSYIFNQEELNTRSEDGSSSEQPAKREMELPPITMRGWNDP